MSKNDYISRLERKEDYPVVENLVLVQCVLKEILTFMEKADEFDKKIPKKRKTKTFRKFILN